MESEKKWYVIHTYSGYENKVKTNLERKVQSMGMEDEIFNVVVPMEDDVEVRDGRKKVMKKKGICLSSSFLQVLRISSLLKKP